MALLEEPEAMAEGAGGGGTAPKGPARMKRPAVPDRAEMDKQVEKLNAETERHAARIKEIKGVLAARRDRSRGASGEESAIMRRLADLRAQFEATKKQKQAWRDEMARADKAREALRGQVKALKGRVKYATVEDIDGQISRLEAELNGGALSPVEEERKVRQIKDLAQSRATVKSYHERLEKMQEDDRMRDELGRRVVGADERLDALKGEMASERGRVGELHAARDDDGAEEARLREEKEECWTIMQALRAKRDAIRDEYRGRYEEFKRRDAEFRRWQSEDRKKRQEAKKKDYEQRQAERAAELAEYEVDVYAEKLLQCDQMLSYLSKFSAPSKEDSAKDEAKEIAAPQPGMKLLNRDEDKDLGWFAGMGKGKAKKTKGKKVVKEDRPADEKKLMHTIDILQAFHRLQVMVPNTMSDIPKTIELVKEKKQQLHDQKEKGVVPDEAPSIAKGNQHSHSKPGSNKKSDAKGAKVGPGDLHGDEYPSLVGTKDPAVQEPDGKAAAEPAAESMGAVLEEKDDGPAVAAEEPATAAEDAVVAAEEPAVAAEEPAVAVVERAAAVDEPAVVVEEPRSAPECDHKEPATTTEKPGEPLHNGEKEKPAEAMQNGHEDVKIKEGRKAGCSKQEVAQGGELHASWTFLL
ncbi:unnamed protein product [Ostreobium quekettii]|uniref:Uncharacterized protein n=1 Tax=Ostreobium quekettii TaxID=121088 RepID=A0A8S1J072_9CHLO|nr:unnamed protein product [Ostreobium quekettii]|eukprot:evm.model.scf_305.2 EVM.evm.TU.scf_305.2   scf_305:6768-10254(+)